MDLQMRKLTPALWQDYLYYFENVAFTNHEEFSINNIVGWSNVDRKANYAPIVRNKEYLSDGDDEQTISIYCMEIAPGYRGRDISHYIIDCICENAKADGYKYVEGYPFVDVDFPCQYHGPLKLYEKHGFDMIRKGDYVYVMRKRL